MEAIILAGGFGTRLRHILPDIPKPMAPIQGRPFLDIVLCDLINKGVHHVVLAVGYRKEQIIQYVKQQKYGIAIDFSVEDIPLGTGGAIRQAVEFCQDSRILVVNGDTFFDVDFSAMLHFSNEMNASLAIAVKEMHHFNRYGCLAIKDGFIVGYKEKAFCETGMINGGVYCIVPNLLKNMVIKSFSFEKDFIEKYYEDFRIPVYVSEGYFIDIGVPEDYWRAQEKWRHDA